MAVLEALELAAVNKGVRPVFADLTSIRAPECTSCEAISVRSWDAAMCSAVAGEFGRTRLISAPALSRGAPVMGPVDGLAIEPH